MTNVDDRRDSTPIIMEKLNQIDNRVNDVLDLAKENRDALRGVGTSPGLVGCVDENTKAIDKLESKSNRNDTIVGIGTIIGSVVGFIFGGRSP